MRLKQTPSQTVGPFFAYGLTPAQYGYPFSALVGPVLVDDDTLGERIRIVGHASGENSERTPGDHTLANFEISLKRATTVSDELMRLGVDPSAIVVEAVGDRASDGGGMGSDAASARRADIYLE